MKLLQNKFVVAFLALVAGIVVFRNAVGPLWQRMRPPRPVATPQAPAPARPSAKADSTTPRSTAPQQAARTPLGTNVDLSQIGWKFNGTPRRDPFHAANSAGF